MFDFDLRFCRNSSAKRCVATRYAKFCRFVERDRHTLRSSYKCPDFSLQVACRLSLPHWKQL